MKATLDMDRSSRFSLTNRNFFDFGNTGMSKMSITNASVGPDAEKNKDSKSQNNKSPARTGKSGINIRDYNNSTT